MRLYEAAAGWDASMAAWGAAASTRKDRRLLLRRLEADYGWRTIELVTRQDCERFLANPRFKPWTRCTFHMHLKVFFAWATETELIPTDPMKGVRRPRTPASQPKALSDAEVDAVMEIARGHTRTWLLLALYAGLRSHEVAKIRGEDVGEDQLFVFGKGAKPATLPTHPKIWELAQNYPTSGWWFPTENAQGHVDGKIVGIRVGYLFRDAGIEKGSIHRCRHTYATRLLRQGTNIRVVQDVMRHASLVTTQAYLEVNNEERRTAINLLS